MSRSVALKAVLVVALVGLALIGRSVGASRDWITPGLVAFGLVNVLFSTQGTRVIRAIAIAATLAALLWPQQLQTAVVLLAWLVWPPAFLVAWALARDVDGPPAAEQLERSQAATRARVTIAAIIGAVAIASVAYRLLVAHSLQQTAALFVGIPALLAIVVVFGLSPRSAAGVACKAVTVGMLVSAIFLGEGVLCIVMSAPLFYAIAVAVGVAVDTWRRFDKAPTTLACLAVLVLGPMSLEGVTDATSLDRDEWVSETRVIQTSADAVDRALFEPPRFDRALPLYLRAGFPRPISTRVEYGAAHPRLVIRFRGGEMRLDGIEPRTGDLVLELQEMRPGSVRWQALADDSHMTHFLLWREARVEWEPVDAQRTRVTWTLRYRRGLDPAWYFGPWERYAARLAAGYLDRLGRNAVIPDDRYLVVRAASLYITVMTTVVLWAWRRPSHRAFSGAVLACFWNVPVLLALHLAAARVGWWEIDARGGLLLGMPVELYLSWAWLWGVIPALAFPSLSLFAVLLIALAADLVLMPAAAPVIRLGPTWLVGELIGLLAGLLPAQLLARWTARDEHLVERATLQMVAFTGLLLFVLPAVVIEGSGGAWLNPMDRPAWQLSLAVQVLAIPALLGLTAVQEFVTRGGGTPVPFDPPRRLVSSGIYAYVGNPMQLSAVILLLLLGLFLRNAWLSAGGVMAHLYSVGLAGWDEGEDLQKRFGEEWITYRRGVRRWLPRCRPYHLPNHPLAHLFVADSCGMCREVGRWFERRGARQLLIVPAESHPSGALTRMTYESGDGTLVAHGVEAVARALEHIHLGWALLAFLLRLPMVSSLAQLLADASGAEPRIIPAPDS